MRLTFALLLLALLAALSGCGGAETQTQSGIPAGVAERLAAQSDAVADSLGSGNECDAARKADDLRNAADEAVASGAVPAEFQSELESAVTELQNEVNCPQPAKQDEDNGKGKKKGHKKNEETTSTGITSTGTTGTSTEESG